MTFSMVSSIIGVIAIVGYIILFVTEMRGFNRTGAKSYNFFRCFPYELNMYRRNSKYSWVYAASLIALGVATAFPYLGFAINATYSSTASTWSIITAYALFVFIVIAVSMFICLSFIKLSNYQAHLICAVIFIAAVLVSDILMLFTFTNDFFVYYEIKDEIRIAILVICLIYLAFILFLMFNPTRKDWAKLQKYQGENNYDRPKYSYLCMLEWGGFLTLILEFIPLYLAMFF